MSGRVPPSQRARAAAIYERFTGHDADESEVIEIPPLPKAVAIIGPLDAVEYTTVREGKTELYRHVFAKSDRPLLCVSPDRRQLLIVGDRFAFTDRGIVDDSDTKNHGAGSRKPRGRR